MSTVPAESTTADQGAVIPTHATRGNGVGGILGSDTEDHQRSEARPWQPLQLKSGQSDGAERRVINKEEGRLENCVLSL